MTDEIHRSELLCIEFINYSIEWLRSLYHPRYRLFHVAISDGDDPRRKIDPNAATSRVGTVVADLASLNLSDVEIRNLHELIVASARARLAVSSADLQDALPLRTFGTLPLFSTALLLEFLAPNPNSACVPAFVVAARRVLREAYVLSSSQTPPQADRPHPYTLYRAYKALISLQAVLDGLAGDPTAQRAFRSAMLSGGAIIASLKSTKERNKLFSVYGSLSDRGFNAFLKEASTWRSGRANGLDQCFQTLESMALAAANSELARFSGESGRMHGDSSALLFSLRVLAARNMARHESILAQGLDATLKGCEYGLFPGNMPFLFDDKGRATFVPSVETANAALSLCLSRLLVAGPGQLQRVLEMTLDVQTRLADGYNTVTVQGPAKSLRGWASDKAPSSARVDSWITVEALAFFCRRLALLRFVKRQQILQEYSWIPHDKCRPTWTSIVDPDLGAATSRTTKAVIETVLSTPPSKRTTAPMFLLYGPPGTSKTTLVQGAAELRQWDLMTLSPSDFVEDTIDRIEQRSRKIFHDLMRMDRCVVLLDEMDSLMRDRELLGRDGHGTILDFVVPALLPKLQQLRDYVLRHDMAVFFTTNYYETIDSAILRGGRIDHHLPVLPYTEKARTDVVQRFASVISRSRQADVGKIALDALRSVGCNLVYRDLEYIVRASAAHRRRGPALAAAKEEAITAGVNPEYYSPKKRPGAFREVHIVIRRLLNKPMPANPSTVSATDVIQFLHESVSALALHPGWKRLAENWIAHLKKHDLDGGHLP